MSRFDRELRWYPKEWRERYGDELSVLLEDTYPGGSVPLRTRMSLIRAGTVERFRGARTVLGEHSLDGVRSGSLLVLCAWALFIVAGAGFAKFAEHWDMATPPGDRRVPDAAYGTVQWASFIGTFIVLTAAALCLPALGRLVRSGGWFRIRRPVLGAGLVTSATVLVGVGVAIWAHRLGSRGSNGGAWPFHVVGVVWVLMICFSIAVLAAASVSVVRQLDLDHRIVRLQGSLAVLMAAVMAAITGGMIAWWVAMARVAPGFLGSGPFGSPGSLVPPAMLVAGAMMVAGLAAALVGVRSVVHSTRQLLADESP